MAKRTRRLKLCGDSGRTGCYDSELNPKSTRHRGLKKDAGVEARSGKPPLIILGAGDYNQRYIRLFNGSYEMPAPPFRLAGFGQNVDEARRGEKLDGYPVYSLSELETLAPTHYAHCGLGDCEAKRRFVEQVEAFGFRFGTLFNLGAVYAGADEIGEGSYLGVYSIVSSRVKLGRHCSVMGQSLLGENVTLGDYCFLAAAVKISGGVTVGPGTFIGTGAIITERVRIGAGAIVGAGSVVIADVPDGAVVVGNPAREIERKGGPLRTRPGAA